MRLVVAAETSLAPPRVSVELRDDGGLVLGAVTHETELLGWNGGAGEREVRFRLARLPLADGRFHLRLALLDAAGHPLHSLDDAVRFFVFPSGEQTGAVLLDGTWSLQATAGQENAEGAPTSRL